MTEEEQKLLDAYKEEVERCFDIAQRLDAFNHDNPGAFSGSPSQRIENQLRAHRVPGFDAEDE